MERRSDSDPYLMLLNYQMTSMECGLSSADILFNRKLKTGVWAARSVCQSQWVLADMQRGR